MILGKIFFFLFFSESESNSLKLIQRITNSPFFFLPDIPVPALPEPESKFLVSVPLTPYSGSNVGSWKTTNACCILVENLSNKLFCLIYGVFVCLMFRTNILDLLVIFLTTSPPAPHPFPAKFPDPSPLDQDKTGLFYEINFLCHFLTPSIANTTFCG